MDNFYFYLKEKKMCKWIAPIILPCCCSLSNLLIKCGISSPFTWCLREHLQTLSQVMIYEYEMLQNKVFSFCHSQQLLTHLSFAILGYIQTPIWIGEGEWYRLEKLFLDFSLYVWIAEDQGCKTLDKNEAVTKIKVGYTGAKISNIWRATS